MQTPENGEKCMSEILCSTGALIGRPNGRDYRLLKELAGQLACDGFEFMMYSNWYEEADRMVEELLAMKLHIPVVHCQKSVGEAVSKGGEENLADAFGRFEINCKIAQRLGAKKMVMHLWDGITSDANFANNISAYRELSAMTEDYGVELLVENVVCNREDPMKHWCELREIYPQIRFVFDTKMAAFHEQIDLLYQEEYKWLFTEDHIRHYHVNDYAGAYKDWKNLKTLPIGKGHIDFERFFDYLKQTGYDGTFTVESTAFGADGSVDVEMLNRQFAYIRQKYIVGGKGV